MPGAAYCNRTGIAVAEPPRARARWLRGYLLTGALCLILRRSRRHGVLDDLLADLLAGLLGRLDVARSGLLAESHEVALRAGGEGRGGGDARLAGIDRLL